MISASYRPPNSSEPLSGDSAQARRDLSEYVVRYKHHQDRTTATWEEVVVYRRFCGCILLRIVATFVNAGMTISVYVYQVRLLIVNAIALH